jgi:hypothetical protein
MSILPKPILQQRRDFVFILTTSKLLISSVFHARTVTMRLEAINCSFYKGERGLWYLETPDRSRNGKSPEKCFLLSRKRRCTVESNASTPIKLIRLSLYKYGTVHENTGNLKTIASICVKLVRLSKLLHMKTHKTSKL